MDGFGSASLVCLQVGAVWDEVTAACLSFPGVKVNPLWGGGREI